MQMRLTVVFGIALALVGCARLDHQTGALEPHGLVRFETTSDPFPDQPVVKTLDGLPVSAGRDYRVKPGKHELVCRVVEIVGPSRRIRHVTNSISIEEGWLYDVTGENVGRTRLSPPAP
jgi:hypothetical protein